MNQIASDNQVVPRKEIEPGETDEAAVMAAMLRFHCLERQRINLRQRLTNWMLSPSSEDDSTDLLARIDAIEAEQDSLWALLPDKYAKPKPIAA